MGRWKTKPTLDDYMAVDVWTEEDLLEVIGFKGEEDVHVEYKSGPWLDDKDPPAKIRKWVAGFANALGGILFIGIKAEPEAPGRPERPMNLSPIRESQQRVLETWIESCLRSGIFPALHPFPRIQSVEGGKYAVVSVRPVGTTLVSVRSGNRDIFPARVGSATVDLDDWAVRAILHGTRNLPVLSVDVIAEQSSVQLLTEEGGGPYARIEALVRISNDGFVSARGLHWGVIAPFHRISARSGHLQALTPTVRGQVARHTEAEDARTAEAVSHVRPGQSSMPEGLPPFGSVDAWLRFDGLLDAAWYRMDLQFAVYLIADGIQPLWYSVSVTHDRPQRARFAMARVDPPVPIWCRTAGAEIYGAPGLAPEIDFGVLMVNPKTGEIGPVPEDVRALWKP